jgi:dienelactone hydrolase
MKIRKETLSNEFKGMLFSPDTKGVFPGVIVLSGSDGGIPESIARHLASFGYVVLALGYFGRVGLSHYLENIHLEYFEKAIQNLKSKENSLTLMGYSRGGELALLLGSQFNQLINAIVAFAPSSIVNGGFPFVNRPGWVLNHQPIEPFMHGLMSEEDMWTEAEDLAFACEKGVIPYHNNTPQDPYEVVDLFLERHKRQDPLRAIPVEHILCPLLILCGEQDRIWPASMYVQQIMDRLDEKGSKIERRSLVYPDAGHGIIAPYVGPIYHPIGKFWCTLGGTCTGNNEANKNAWQEVLKFMERFK